MDSARHPLSLENITNLPRLCFRQFKEDQKGFDVAIRLETMDNESVFILKQHKHWPTTAVARELAWAPLQKLYATLRAQAGPGVLIAIVVSGTLTSDTWRKLRSPEAERSMPHAIVIDGSNANDHCRPSWCHCTIWAARPSQLRGVVLVAGLMGPLAGCMLNELQIAVRCALAQVCA